MSDFRDTLPSLARLVNAAGAETGQSLAQEYDPAPGSGRRQRFMEDLERLADAEREEIISSAEILL